MSFYFYLHWLSVLKSQVRTSLKPISSVCVHKDLEGQASQFFFTCVSDRIINRCVHSSQMSLLSYTCMHACTHVNTFFFLRNGCFSERNPSCFMQITSITAKFRRLRKVELASCFFFFPPEDLKALKINLKKPATHSLSSENRQIANLVQWDSPFLLWSFPFFSLNLF